MAFTWALNPFTWDIFLNGSGTIQNIWGNSEVVQRIIVTLQHVFGEYWLYTTHGLPWWQTPANNWAILGSKDYKTVEMIIRSAVLDVPGVVGIASINMSTPRASNNRAMQIEMQVEVAGLQGPQIANIVLTLKQTSANAAPAPGAVQFGVNTVMFGNQTVVF